MPRRASSPREARSRRPVAPRRRRDAPASSPGDLRPSLESTRDGLRTLLRSLQESGLPQSVGPYREMQRVLILQNQWSRRTGSTELDPLWHEIAAAARDIRDLLGAFAQSLVAVADLDADGARRAPAGPEASIVEAVLDRRATTAARLSATLGIPPDDLAPVLAGLVADGRLERRGWGRGAAFAVGESLRDRARRAIVRDL